MIGGGVFETISSAAGLAGSLWQTARAGQYATANREWQEAMSSSAHQREVNDLRAAGLNPILSATHGGSPVPGGATAVPAGGNPGSAAVSGAVDAARLMNDLATGASQRKVLAAEEEVKRAEAEYKRSLPPVSSAQAAELRARVPKHEQDVTESRARVPVYAQQISESQIRAELAGAQTASERERVKNLQMEREKVRTEIAELEERMGTLRTQQERNQAESSLARLQGEYLKVRRELAAYSIPAARNSAEIQDDEFQRSFVPRLNSVLRAIPILRNLID